MQSLYSEYRYIKNVVGTDMLKYDIWHAATWHNYW